MKLSVFVVFMLLVLLPGCQAAKDVGQAVSDTAEDVAGVITDDPVGKALPAGAGAVIGSQFGEKNGALIGAALGILVTWAADLNIQLEQENATLQERVNKARKTADELEEYNRLARLEIDKTDRQIDQLKQWIADGYDVREETDRLSGAIRDEIQKDENLIAETDKSIRQLELAISGEEQGPVDPEMAKLEAELNAAIQKLKKENFHLMGVKTGLEDREAQVEQIRQ